MQIKIKISTFVAAQGDDAKFFFNLIILITNLSASSISDHERLCKKLIKKHSQRKVLHASCECFFFLCRVQLSQSNVSASNVDYLSAHS